MPVRHATNGPVGRPWQSLCALTCARTSLGVRDADLATEFARHDLIDEYQLYVHPMVIGCGTPMLSPSDAKVPLRLIETHNFGNGVVMLRYARRLLGPPADEPLGSLASPPPANVPDQAKRSSDPTMMASSSGGPL
jgi:hypothetical protein